MKTATGLTVIAIGAILAFAITASPTFLDLNTVGWILMLTGAVGIAFTPRGQNWLRRRVIVRRPPASPGPPPSRAALPHAPIRPQAPGGAGPAASKGSGIPESKRPSGEPADEPPTETIEEYIEQ